MRSTLCGYIKVVVYLGASLKGRQRETQTTVTIK